MFSNSPLLYASNAKCAKMYKLWREILAEKTGGTGGLWNTERLKTQGLSKFANTYMEPIHHNTACIQMMCGYFNFGHCLHYNHSNSRSLPYEHPPINFNLAITAEFWFNSVVTNTCAICLMTDIFHFQYVLRITVLEGSLVISNSCNFFLSAKSTTIQQPFKMSSWFYS